MNNRETAAGIARGLCASVGDQIARMIEAGCFPPEWDGHQVRALLADEFAREVSDKARGWTRTQRKVFEQQAAEGMQLRHDFAGGPAPLRVLVTVSGGVAHVDHCPEGVTVEVRDFDQRDDSGAPTAYENGPGDTSERVELAEQLDADGDGFADTWRRADNARPEFDGPAPEVLS